VGRSTHDDRKVVACDRLRQLVAVPLRIVPREVLLSIEIKGIDFPREFVALDGGSTMIGSKKLNGKAHVLLMQDVGFSQVVG
jgi:hypothetical protein